jgi:thioredoxin 1
MASEKLLQFTDANFETEVVKSALPVLVDFWAEWCMPCRMIAPIVDELAEEYDGRFKIGKLDTDNNREVAKKLQISAIPTLILFKGGQPVRKLVGLKSKRDLKEELDKLLT